MTKVFWNYFFVMIWFAYLLCSGVHLFSRGFLLSRNINNEVNNCTQLKICSHNDDNCLNEEMVGHLLHNVNSSNKYCLPQKSKVILIVIDALKYDFGVYNKSIENPLPYQNKLPILNELIEEFPLNTRMSRFIADPPTTTLQRLNGLTTGSLPTFIDMGSNFATAEINEDNIIDQIVNNNKTAIFMGDSTWTELFPKRFKRSFSFPSFNIFDLDTVDNGIRERLPLEMQETDWDLLIAHFLGVDHCGHRYGPRHMEMTRKLNEMNEVISKIVKDMDENTILFVIGDHGMTETGDHGGDTEDELNALLFAYSKKNRFYSSDSVEKLQQIDLVPILAAILGVPIPYSNLGTINFNYIPDLPLPHLQSFQVQMLHFWQNALQMHNYFYNYAINHTGVFDEQAFDDMDLKFLVLSYRVISLYTDAAYEHFRKDLRSHLKLLLHTCHDVWIKFNTDEMFLGLILTFSISFFIFLIVNNLTILQLEQLFTKQRLYIIYGLHGITLPILYLCNDIVGTTVLYDPIVFSCTISCVLIMIIISQNWMNIAENWHNVIKRYSNMATRIIYGFSICIFFSNSFIIEEQKILSFLLIGIILLIWYNIEQKQFDGKKLFKLNYLFNSKLLKLTGLTIIGIIMLRLTNGYFKCREEQENCINFISPTTSATYASKFLETVKKSSFRKTNRLSDILPIVILALFTTLTRIYLRSCGNLTGYSKNVIFSRYGPIIATICTAGHFILNNTTIYRVKQINIDALAWTVYGLFVVELLIVLRNPLMVYVMPKVTHRTNPIMNLQLSPYKNVVPEIFKRMKDIYDGGDINEINRLINNSKIEQMNENDDDVDRNLCDGTDDIPIVYGLGTVYSSVLILLSIMFTLLVTLLLGPNVSNGLIFTIGAAIIVLILSTILRYESSKSLDKCLQPNFITLVTWYLLIQYAFYSTSHQPTISQIDWHAAFVGRSAKFDHTNFISAILIILNTFGGLILCSILYPLLVLFGSSMYGICPSLMSSNILHKNHPPQLNRNYRRIFGKVMVADSAAAAAALDNNSEHDFDISRGELTMYENENLFFGTIFKVGCQLFILQGLRIFCSMLACTIHCRHLMVWKIFAPKFIFEGISFYIMLISIIIGYFIIVRVHLSLNGLITKLTKSK